MPAVYWFNNPTCAIYLFQVPWRTAYNGLARGVIKVTLDAATDPSTRALIRTIDADTGHSTVLVANPSAAPSAPIPITVRASAPGLLPATVVIEVSVNADVDGVLSTARTSVNLPVALD